VISEKQVLDMEEASCDQEIESDERRNVETPLDMVEIM
jgi:hypothetical protein